jgi:serine/threonine protein kinase
LLEQHPTKKVNAVLTDFGISNVVDERVLKVKAFEVKHRRGLTVAYAAPEAIVRFRDKNRIQPSPQVAKAGDVYSFAILIHTLVGNAHSEAEKTLQC